jgi:hypothetical protein
VKPYETQTITRNGTTLVVEYHYDDDSGKPWKDSDGHGVVSEWTRRDKKPGERVLHENRGARLYYDVQQTMAIALRDGWGVAGQTFATKRQQAAAAVEVDFQYLRRWCQGDWFYIGIVVRTEDDEVSHSLWGIESDATEYHKEIVEELAAQCLRQIAGSVYPVNEIGV